MPDRPLRHHQAVNLRRLLDQHPASGGLCPECSNERARVPSPCPLRTLAEQELARRQTDQSAGRRVDGPGEPR